MNWIRKLEEEKRAEQQRQAQAQADKLKEQSEETRRFQTVRDKLSSVIQASISELQTHTGFELQMTVGDTFLVVRAPHPKPEIFEKDGAWYQKFGRVSDHYFKISSISNDAQTVRVQAIRAGLTNRNPDLWEQSNLSYDDYFGSDKTLIDARNDVDKLLSEDIQLLLEWLVREETEKHIAPPEISSVLREQNEHRSAKRNAWFGLACGILAFPCGLVFLAPLAIFLGIRAYRSKYLTGTSKYYESAYGAETGAKWAIGLGIFGTLILIIEIIGLASLSIKPPSTANSGVADQRYGAIAYSVSTKRIGVRVNYPDLEGAKARALQECNAPDCELKIWFWDICAALARAGNGQALASGGNSKSEAESAALNECSKIGEDCTVIFSVCSGRPSQP